jgi:hypothetical protein
MLCGCVIVEEPEAQDSPEKKPTPRGEPICHLTDSQSIVIVAMLLNLNPRLAMH